MLDSLPDRRYWFRVILCICSGHDNVPSMDDRIDTSHTTIRNILDELIDSNLVKEDGYVDTEGRGRGPKRYRLTVHGKVVVNDIKKML